MGLSATKFFKHWPEMAKEYEDISLHNAWMATYKHSGEQMIPPMLVSQRLRAQGLDPKTPPGTFQMRPLVYEMFIRQVERLGIPIEYNCRVVDYYENLEQQKGGVLTDDDRRYEADLVIAADGVGSKSHKLIGTQPRAKQSGRAMWRAAFPIKFLDKNPEVKEFFGKVNGTDPIIRTWLGPSTYALTLTRDDTMIWIMNHDVTGTESESWNSTVDVKEVLEGMDRIPGPHKWASIFKDLVECTPDNTVINFSLLWRNPQACWTSPNYRIVQIGDSAHSFLPSSANGATQGIEDAVSLASCLHIAGKENIQQAVRAHMRFRYALICPISSYIDGLNFRHRFVRVTCAQKIGFSNADLLQNTDWEKVKLDPRRAAPKLPKWVWSHDPEQYTYENYWTNIDSMNKGIRFEDDERISPNYPPGYRYVPWDIEDIMRNVRNGKPIDLGPGDWD